MSTTSFKARTDGILFEPEQSWSGYTTKTHLSKIRQIAPKWGETVMTYVGTANRKGMTGETYLKQIAKVKYEDTDDPINFMIYGEGMRKAVLVSYTAPDMARPGINKTRFTLTFETALFSDVMVVVGMNDAYRIRIVSDPIKNGSYFDYVCELMGDKKRFVPPQELQAGHTFTREGAPVPMTDSMKGAKPSYSSPYARTFTWSSVRTQDDVPGNMKTRPVAFAWRDDNGKAMYTWSQYRTWTNDMLFDDLKNNTLVWGRNNMNDEGNYDDIDERSGIEITEGDGLVPQMERGNLNYYNSFDLDEFEEKILTLRVGKNASDKTHYVIKSGTRGLRQIHNAIAEKVKGWTLHPNDQVFGARSKLGFGYSFRRYESPSGFMMDFMFDPMLDDTDRTPLKHPDGGYARSYEYHIMDMGTTKGVDNIELRYVKDMTDEFRILPGFRNPYSATGAKLGGDFIASAKDAWSEHRMSQFMVIIKNPKNTMIYRPNVQRSYYNV